MVSKKNSTGTRDTPDREPPGTPVELRNRWQPPPRILPSPSKPLHIARWMAEEFFNDPFDHEPRLHYWQGAWYVWQRTHWEEVEEQYITKLLYEYTEDAVYLKAGTDEDPTQAPWDPNKAKIANLRDALTVAAYLEEVQQVPTWVESAGFVEVENVEGEPVPAPEPPGLIVACRNGLLDVASRRLLPHSPLYFNFAFVAVDYTPKAPPPKRWLRFMRECYGRDTEQIALLQEWFGYLISGRTDLEKILLMIGPTRGGKGVTAHILRELLGGSRYVVGPTLASLYGPFGLEPLIGKTLATVTDARLDKRRDTSVIVERLLSISGTDNMTVDRKHRSAWTGNMPTRVMMLSNELPQFDDASAAIVGRLLLLELTESWLGREDIHLKAELLAELPGILNWSLDGLARLEAAGSFTVPQSTRHVAQQLVELSSPVKAFVAERCRVGPDCQVKVDELWQAWQRWCEANGQPKGSAQSLGQALKAAYPRQVSVRRPGTGPGRGRVYQGVGLRATKARVRVKSA